jgi:hypothetical protein
MLHVRLLGRRLFSGSPLSQLVAKPCRFRYAAPSRASGFHDLRCMATDLPVKKQRPSKTAAKREVQHIQKLATQLCKLTDKQLERLSPLLEERAIEAIVESRGIHNRSKAKGRQEAFVAKLLREELEEGQQQLLEVCARARVH